tara:strand:- start:42 stop:338 length:297 start_codon:yes stop_codon:yes gene_type:complete
MGIFYGSLRHDVTGRKKRSYARKAKAVTRGSVHVSQRANYRRSVPEYPSHTDTAGVAPRVESPRYTGTLVKGIGTMHKSNAVPIIDEEQMKDIARMRR